MGKRKRKSYQQPLFIQFVNSKLEREDILDIVDKASNIACFIKWQNIDYLKELVDINKFNNYKPKDKYRFELQKRMAKLGSKEEILDYLDDNEKREKEEIRRKLSDVNDAKTWRKESNMGIHLALDFFYNLKHFQLKIQHILKKVVRNEKPDTDLFIWHYAAINTIFYHGDEGYLQKKLVPGHINFTDPDDIRYGNLYWDEVMNIIFYNLTEFLCTHEWKKLKQCKKCEKFFVAKVERNDIKFCNRKCKQSHWNKEYTKIGKHAEYMRRNRPGKPNWIT